METTETAVLVLGFNVDGYLTEKERTWYDLVIGPKTPRFDQGRATLGVRLAYEQNARIFFSTGASKRDGLLEAEYTYREVLRHIEQIAAALGTTSTQLHAWLEEHKRLDTDSKNTLAELHQNLRMCFEEGVKRVYLVTNQFHLPRAMADANQVCTETDFGGMGVFGISPRDGTSRPVIFEEPSHPDQNRRCDARATMRQFFSIPPEEQPKALAELKAILAGYAKPAH